METPGKTIGQALPWVAQMMQLTDKVCASVTEESGRQGYGGTQGQRAGCIANTLVFLRAYEQSHRSAIMLILRSQGHDVFRFA